MLASDARCTAATTTEDDDASDADEADSYTASMTGTTITAGTNTLEGSSSFAIIFHATIN